MARQPLGDIEDACGKVDGLVCPQEVTVLLHCRPAPGGVNQYRLISGQLAYRLPGQLPCSRGQTGVGLEGAAARDTVPGRPGPETGSFDHPLRVYVDAPLPGVHDAAGKQVDVIARRVHLCLTPRQRW